MSMPCQTVAVVQEEEKWLPVQGLSVAVPAPFTTARVPEGIETLESG